MALSGDCQAKNYAYELEDALKTLSTFDEGPDLVLYYKYLLFLKGDADYQHHLNAFDELAQARKILRRASWLCLNGGGIDGQGNNILWNSFQILTSVFRQRG